MMNVYVRIRKKKACANFFFMATKCVERKRAERSFLERS